MSTCVKAYDNFPYSIFIGFEKLFEYLLRPGTLPGSLFSSVTQLCPTLCHPIDCNMPGLPAHHQLPEFTQTYVHRVGDAIQPSYPLSFPSPPAFNLSQHQGLFQWVLQIRWPKYWSFSFNISPSNECSGLISFRMGCLDLLALQVTLKSHLLRDVLCANTTVQKHQFFSAQLSL